MGGCVATELYSALAYSERGDGSDRRKASHLGFIHRMAKRENVQPFACLAGQFSTQGQVLREQVVQCGTRDPRDREFPSRFTPPDCDLMVIRVVQVKVSR